MDQVTFKLPLDVIARLERIAHDEDVSVGQVIREAVERDFHRREVFAAQPRTPPPLLRPIRDATQEAFLKADGWRDLRTRLVEAGYTLREAGGGLALHDAITGRFLCRSSEIGFGYPALMRRFGAPFPGHSKTPVLNRISAASLASLASLPGPVDAATSARH